MEHFGKLHYPSINICAVHNCLYSFSHSSQTNLDGDSKTVVEIISMEQEKEKGSTSTPEKVSEVIWEQLTNEDFAFMSSNSANHFSPGCFSLFRTEV